MKNIILISILLILFNSAGGIYFTFFRLPMNGLLILSLFFYLLIIQKTVQKAVMQKASLAFLTLLFLVLFNYLTAIPGQSANTYGFMLITLFSAYFANLIISENDMIDKFIIVLYIIAIHAFLNFLVFPYVSGSLQSYVISTEKVYQTFHYLFFYSAKSTLDGTIQIIPGLSFNRNMGMFWEPGILQLFLNLLLFVQLFYRKTAIYKVVFTVFVLITTFSTTGLLTMLTIMLFKFKSLITFKNFFIVLPIGLLIISPLLPLIFENVADKTTGKHATSGYVRFFDFLQGIAMTKDYPLSGVGLSIDPMWALQERSYKTVFGFTIGDPSGGVNSIVKIFTMLGLPTALLYFYALYRQTVFTKHKKIFFLILLMTFMGEPIGLRTLFIFLVMNGLMDIIGSLLPLKHTRLEEKNRSLSQ